MSRFFSTAVPVEVTHAAQVLKNYAAKNSSTDNWFIYGLGPVQPLKARILLLESALVHEYNEEWDVGDGITDAEKVQFLIDRIPK